jgi:hypothetical protein
MLVSSAEVKSRRRALALIATGYLRNQILSPFVRIAAGYEWTEVEHVYRAVGPAGTSVLANQKESEAVWGAGFGAEILAGKVAFTPALDYRDEYRNVYTTNVGKAVTYSLTAHTWLTKSLGGFGRAGYTQPSSDFAEDVWSAEIGIRVGF